MFSPNLVKHAVTNFDTVDVVRFLGRRVGEKVHHRFEGDVFTTVKTRNERPRVKHALNRNSIKMYDKQGSVLRVETTVNAPREMKVFVQRKVIRMALCRGNVFVGEFLICIAGSRSVSSRTSSSLAEPAEFG